MGMDKSPLKIVIKYILVIIGIEIVFGVIEGIFDIPDYNLFGFALNILNAVLIIKIINKVYTDIYKENILNNFNKNIGTIKTALIAILLIIACLFLDYITKPIMDTIPSPKIFDEIWNEVLNKPSTTMGIIIALLSVVIVAPLLEEIVFRGFIYKTLRSKYSIWLSILISYILFYLFHVDPRMIFILLVTTIVLCLSYEYSKSLVLPFLIHSGFNFGSLILFWYLWGAS